MGEVISLEQNSDHVVIATDEAVNVLAVSSIRMIATGKICISEFESPDKIGQALAVLAMESIDGVDR